jgi:hypothetical protein
MSRSMIVEVRYEVDRVLLDVAQKLHRERREPGFRVSIGRCVVAIDRTEVALPIHQRVAQRKVLHHAHERLVNRHVTVRMEFAEHFTDHGRAFLVRPTCSKSRLVHRIQDAPVHRLQPVAHIGQGALHNHTHRISEE